MAKGRRGYGEGGVSQLKNGRWRGQVRIGGKRVTQVKDTKREILAWMKEMHAQMEKGLTYEASKTTFGEFLLPWMAKRQLALRVSTYQLYNMCVKNYILPALGNIKFKDLKPAKIQAFYDRLLDEGVGPRTVQVTHVVVHSCLDQAEVLGLVARNPSKGLELPNYQKRKAQYWNEGQVSQFMVAVQGHRNEHLYHLALTTGMREGELLGLKWSGIDWLDKTLLVYNSAYWPRGGGFIFNEPKTEKGNRTVELGDGDIEILRLQMARVAELRRAAKARWKENDLVFPSTVGTPITRSNFLKEFKGLCRLAGVTVIRFHDIRHTSASLMIAQGVDRFTISRRLGHSSTQVTEDLYGHLMPGKQRIAAQALNELVRPIRVDKESE